MYQKKLMALTCNGVYCRWSVVWIGDSLSQLPKSELRYFISVYGCGFLRLSSEYVFDEEEEGGIDCFGDWFED